MEKTTISKLKSHLSAYLRKVREGQTILVLDRDEPVARIERVEAGGRSDDRLARLERDGLLRRAGVRRLDLAPFRQARASDDRGVLDALLAERREGR